jgi:GNAT superfamily N-acetyltransferase
MAEHDRTAASRGRVAPAAAARRVPDERDHPFTCRLRDGRTALIRPIEPDDKWRLVEGLKLLSPESRYLRFHASVERLSEAQLRYFTEIDYHDHMAWVALDPDAPDQPGMAVARYVRLPDEPHVAEAAVTVADAYQGLGLGTILLGLLARTAVSNGIDVFRNYVLADNAAMLELLAQLGSTQIDEGHGVYRVDVPLPENPDDLPDTPAGRVFRAAASGELEMLGGTTGGGERGWLREHLDIALDAKDRQ